MQKGLSSPKNVRDFLPKADETVKDFVKFLPKRFDERNEISDFLDDLSRIYLELACLITFDERLKCFSDKEMQENSISTRLIQASHDGNHSILPTDQGFLWQFFETSDYKKLKESQEIVDKFAVDLIAKKAQEHSDGNSLLNQYLNNPNLDVKDIYGMAADVLLAGVHTTSFSNAFALHYISKDRRVQNLMYEEALKVLPKIENSISPSILSSEIPYTRAVLKETFRLNPVAIGVGRVANKDIVLGGYQIPKDVRIL